MGLSWFFFVGVLGLVEAEPEVPAEDAEVEGVGLGLVGQVVLAEAAERERKGGHLPEAQALRDLLLREAAVFLPDLFNWVELWSIAWKPLGPAPPDSLMAACR